MAAGVFHLHTWLWETLVWSTWQQQDLEGHTTLEVSPQDHPHPQPVIKFIQNIRFVLKLEPGEPDMDHCWGESHFHPIRQQLLWWEFNFNWTLFNSIRIASSKIVLCATCTPPGTLLPGGRLVGRWPCQAIWSLLLGVPSTQDRFYHDTSYLLQHGINVVTANKILDSKPLWWLLPGP